LRNALSQLRITNVYVSVGSFGIVAEAPSRLIEHNRFDRPIAFAAGYTPDPTISADVIGIIKVVEINTLVEGLIPLFSAVPPLSTSN